MDINAETNDRDQRRLPRSRSERSGNRKSVATGPAPEVDRGVTDDITIDVPTADDGDAFFAAMMHAFGEDGTPAYVEHEKMVFEPERCLAARRDGVIVGTAGIFTRRLSVPGASVPAGHVTFVSVAPTARRRGVLSRFIKRQFDDMATAGEPVAVLWAKSEARIYQRFGYGMAVRKLALTARFASSASSRPADQQRPPRRRAGGRPPPRRRQDLLRGGRRPARLVRARRTPLGLPARRR